MTREDIIKAAIEIMAENGLSGFSTKMILEKVDCSEALIYTYFKSKDDLLIACIQRFHDLNEELYRESLPAAIRGVTDPMQIGRKAFLAYLKHHQKYYNETKFYHAMANSKYQGLIREYHRRLYEDYYNHMFEGTSFQPYIDKILTMMSMESLHLFLTKVVLDTLVMYDKDKMDDPKVDGLIVDLFFSGINGISRRNREGAGQ